jgi:hypothetical protein
MERLIFWLLSLVVTVVPIICDYGIPLYPDEYIKRVVLPGYAIIILFLFIRKMYIKWLDVFGEKCLENGKFRDDKKTSFYFWLSYRDGNFFVQLLWPALLVLSLYLSGYRGYQSYTEEQQLAYFESFPEKRKIRLCKKWYNYMEGELYENCQCSKITGKELDWY